ncbi:MAG: hypothetical protein Q8P29_01475 [Candidatus Levybacteria bacterium]|nr:hypothetical protein [Candidatus Levybacteria bacterium]
MEGKPDMPPNSQSTNPEHSEAKPVSAETQAAAERTVLEKLLNNPKTPIEVRRQLEALIKEAAQKGSRKPSQEVRQEAEKNEPVVSDKKAAELVDRFKMENGRNDPEKIFNLRAGLSERIQLLEKEMDKIAASKDSLTDEGGMTPGAELDRQNIENKIREIHEYLTSIPLDQNIQNDEEADDRRRKTMELNSRAEKLIKSLSGRGNDAVNNLANLTDEKRMIRRQLVEEIDSFLKKSASPDAYQFPSELLYSVRYFKELREGVISEILFKSFEDVSETNDYEVGLYASSNLDFLLGFLSKDDNKAYKYFFSLKTAARYFQTMNSTVIKGNFEHFSQAAENINYQHFENMRDIRGSGLAMRLYEQAYKDVLASDKRVMQDKIEWIRDFAETTFREMNGAGLIKSEYSGYRTDSKMEDWEIQRALATGRTFLNITLRAAESIATGRVPIYNEDGTIDRRRYASEPQEDMVRILNWNEWLLAKFTVGGGKEGRQGEEFLKRSTAEFQEFLRYKGAKLDINKITECGGVDIRKMENGGQYKTSGIYSGWRLENMAFDQVYFNLDGHRISVQQFIDKKLEVKDLTEDLLKILKERKILVDGENNELLLFKGKWKATILNVAKALKDEIKKKGEKRHNEDPSKWVDPEDQEIYKELFMPVVNNLDYGLSMLIKNGDFGAPQDNKLGYLLREEIWKKIARTNTPLMIDYLTDIRYADKTVDTEKARNIETIRRDEVPGWSEDQWRNFRKKELLKFERSIEEGMGEDLSLVAKEYELNEEEERLENAIKTEGEKLAPHLADVVFAYTPFMNDMPFEKFHYDVTGQTFYKRRTVSDLGGYNKGQQAFNKIVDNPGGIPAKAVVEAMGEIVAGVAGPEGPRAGMEANFPTFSALLDVATTDPGKRQALYKGFLGIIRKETSTAQRWAGIKADSFTEAEAANLIDDVTRAGILNPELAEYLKKKKKLSFSTIILWMLFRDVFLIVGPINIAREFIGTLKEK